MKKCNIIKDYFINNPDDLESHIPAHKIINRILYNYQIQVSERSIQRVRKQLIEEKGNNTMTDVNKSHDDDKTVTGSDLSQLSDKDIDVINMANEGGWSVQQMAMTSPYTVDEIKSIIRRNSSYIDGDVLDEDSDDVYFTTSNESEGSTGKDADGISDGAQEIIDAVDDIYGTHPYHSGSGIHNYTPHTPVEEDFWEVEQECVDTCGKTKNMEISVRLEYLARRKALMFMKWAGAREWLAYLIGKEIEIGKDKKKGYLVTDLFIPDQATSSTLVNKIEAKEYNSLNIIGVIHSHHEMGAGEADNPSFSGHDERFINSNHNISLLAGRDKTSGGFKIVGIGRAKTPCGAFVRIKAKVEYLSSDPNGDKKLKKEFLEKTQTANNYGGVTYGNNVGGGAGGRTCGFHRHNYPNYPKGTYFGGQGNQGYTPPTKTSTPGGKVYPVNAQGIVETRKPGFHFNKS